MVTVTGACAQRSPWSRFRALAARAVFIGGLGIGGWLGATGVADAVELDHPRVEVEQIVVDAVAKPETALDPVARPVVEPPEPAEPAVERPDIDRPVPPIGGTEQPTVVADDTDDVPPAPATFAPPPRQHSAAPATDDRAASLPKRSPVPTRAARTLPEPRAPDASAPSRITPPTSPAPEPPAPPAPATSLSAGTTSWGGGLRGLLVILPTGPNPAESASAGVAYPENRPATGVPSFEPSTSPD
ncbi:hypothetical protein AB0I53_13095 [Saccharopolyspora sp. NPDC050389]|uniref:hypothetical protein n=1 Tax=Saccharopolyspora sp. NPDC050389 TaxID=3155516 RepID=UPI0033D92513